MLREHIVSNRNVPLKGGLPSEKWWKGLMVEMFSDQKSGWILKAYPSVKTLLFDDLKARHHPNNRRYQIIADINFLCTCKFTTLTATTGPFHFWSIESRTKENG